MRERREHDGRAEPLSHGEGAVEVLAADVVDEVTIFRVPLEDVDAHEVDQRRRVRGQTKEAAARSHLHHFDAVVYEHATVVECLRADDAHVVSARGESRRELIGEAL